MRLNDAVIGSFLIVFAVAMIAWTATFPAMPGQNYGPALFPRIIGAGMIGCGLLLVLQGRRAGGRRLDLGEWAASRRDRLNLLLVPLTLLFYILAVDWLGFVPTAAIIMTLLIARLGTPLLPAVLVALAATLVVHTLFARFLLVPLPWGLLQPVAW